MKLLEIGEVVKLNAPSVGWEIRNGYLRLPYRRVQLVMPVGVVGEIVDRQEVKVSSGSGKFVSHINAYKVKFKDREVWMRRSFITRICQNMLTRSEEICQKCENRFVCYTTEIF
jgi:hypothetical protein